MSKVGVQFVSACKQVCTVTGQWFQLWLVTTKDGGGILVILFYLHKFVINKLVQKVQGGEENTVEIEQNGA